MKGNIKLALFFVLLLGLFTILLCTESSRWFSASIAIHQPKENRKSTAYIDNRQYADKEHILSAGL